MQNLTIRTMSLALILIWALLMAPTFAFHPLTPMSTRNTRSLRGAHVAYAKPVMQTCLDSATDAITDAITTDKEGLEHSAGSDARAAQPAASRSSTFAWITRTFLGTVAAINVLTFALPAIALFGARPDTPSSAKEEKGVGHISMHERAMALFAAPPDSPSSVNEEKSVGHIWIQETSKTPVTSRGWQQDIDPRTGKVFYINHETRQWSWDPPNEFTVAPRREWEAANGDSARHVTRVVSVAVGVAGVAVSANAWATSGTSTKY